MRLADVAKRMGVVLLVVAALVAPAALAAPPAHDPACVQACTQQYLRAKAECLATYNAALALAQIHEDQCLQLPPDQQAACLRDVDSERRSAKNAYNKCLNTAKKDYNTCQRNCPPPSPTGP